jgi:hypothetical protein
MNRTFLIVTSIASQDHPILNRYAKEAIDQNVTFILVGDVKSPAVFSLKGCDFYSIESQYKLKWTLSKKLPLNHYSRKNLGYLEAISKGADIIIETDDDNIPLQNFWEERTCDTWAKPLTNSGWVNIYKYFSHAHVWPRGFPLENLSDNLTVPGIKTLVTCPIQQGLVDINPDVDAIYRLVMSSPVTFNITDNIALGKDSFCPFNSQNTRWFRQAFLLLYLPAYCTFRMTDIWRSFVAQRIAWTCGWSILYHQSTAFQERNVHNLMNDFKDEIPGYLYSKMLFEELQNLNLIDGMNYIEDNLLKCYQLLVDLKLVDKAEIDLLKLWILDVKNALKT